MYDNLNAEEEDDVGFWVQFELSNHGGLRVTRRQSQLRNVCLQDERRLWTCRNDANKMAAGLSFRLWVQCASCVGRRGADPALSDIPSECGCV
jgi:hypothetical protein